MAFARSWLGWVILGVAACSPAPQTTPPPGSGAPPQLAPDPQPQLPPDPQSQLPSDPQPQPTPDPQPQLPPDPHSGVARAPVACRDDVQACQGEGRCTDGPSGCVASSAADCRSSTHCQSAGLCKLEGDRCVVSAAECKRLPHCQQSGCFVFGNRCLRRHACSCGYHGGPQPPQEMLEQMQKTAEACYKAAGGKLPGVCAPAP